MKRHIIILDTICCSLSVAAVTWPFMACATQCYCDHNASAWFNTNGTRCMAWPIDACSPIYDSLACIVSSDETGKTLAYCNDGTRAPFTYAICNTGDYPGADCSVEVSCKP